MPKPHKSTESSTYISISPWMSRKSNRDRDHPDQNQQSYYTVVEEDLVVHSVTHRNSRNEEQSPSTQPKSVSPWHVASSNKCTQQQPVINNDVGDFDIYDDEDNDAIVTRNDSTIHNHNNTPQQHATALAINGTATLLLSFHPTNNEESSLQTTITGILEVPMTNIPWLDYHNRKNTNNNNNDDTNTTNTITTKCLRFPIHGKGITSYRECTRDAEWSVVKLNIYGIPQSIPSNTENSSGQHDIISPSSVMSVVVERTGGDAMRLHGPVEWHGSEIDEASDLTDECTPNVVFDFECHALLTGSKGMVAMMEVMPQFGNDGEDVVVNVGECRIQWNVILEEEEEDNSSDDD